MHPIRMRKYCLRLSSTLLCISLVAPLLFAQSEGNGHRPSLRGFSAGNGRSEMDWENKMRGVPKAEFLREYMKRLSGEPHHVGSAYDKQNAEWIRDKFKSWGIDAKLEEFDVLFPTPTERIMEMTEPSRFKAVLKEPAIPEDPDSGDANQ